MGGSADVIPTEVVFRWLMAGHGWQVELMRFEYDLSYVARLMDFATDSGRAVRKNILNTPRSLQFCFSCKETGCRKVVSHPPESMVPRCNTSLLSA